MQAALKMQEDDEAGMLDDYIPSHRPKFPLQFMGRDHKVQPTAQRMAHQTAPHNHAAGEMGGDPEGHMVSFAPVCEEEGRATPSVFAPVGRGAAHKQGMVSLWSTTCDAACQGIVFSLRGPANRCPQHLLAAVIQLSHCG